LSKTSNVDVMRIAIMATVIHFRLNPNKDPLVGMGPLTVLDYKFFYFEYIFFDYGIVSFN